MLTYEAGADRRLWQIANDRRLAYEVIETTGLFDPGNPLLRMGGERPSSRRFVVIDESLQSSWSESIKAYFDHHGMSCRICAVPTSEKNKSFDLFFRIVRELDDFMLNRRSEPILCIGGGVLSDVVSFVASCYRRGTPYIRVPTTLMGYVDASLGIKTGVNFDGQKNRIGTFAPPMASLLDRVFLRTVPRRHLVNGVGEIVKLAVIKDATLFALLETEGAAAIRDRFQERGGEILRRAIHGMLEELEPNLYEENLERVVDFGHTFSPMLEMESAGELLHGEAVAIDVAFSVVLAEQRGMLSRGQRDRILSVMRGLGLPIRHRRLRAEALWEGLQERTAHRDGRQRVPLPTALGSATFVHDIRLSELARAAHCLESWRGGHERRMPAFGSRPLRVLEAGP